MMIFGLLGYGYYSDPSRFAFYSCLIPAFLVFLFLMTGSYPQRYFDFYDEDYPPYLIVKIEQVISYVSARNEGLEESKTASKFRDSFADQIGIKGFKGSRIGRELLFQDAGKEHRNWQDRYDER